mgnify:CR=1 FL=1
MTAPSSASLGEVRSAILAMAEGWEEPPAEPKHPRRRHRDPAENATVQIRTAPNPDEPDASTSNDSQTTPSSETLSTPAPTPDAPGTEKPEAK